ncbi:MAG: AAA family ATPase [bacterium]|nr:AAA family ATPase [bacterium]
MKKFTLFILLIFVVQNTKVWSDNFYNEIYDNKASALFDLSKTTNSPSYKTANTQSQASLLEQQFIENQQQAYCETNYLLGGMIGSILAYISFKSLLISKKATIETAQNYSPSYLASNILTTAWAAFIYPIAWYFAEDTTKVVTGKINSIKSCWLQNSSDELFLLELEYVRKKPQYSSVWQKIIENNFFEARNKFHMRSQYLAQNKDENFHLTFAKMALGLPMQGKDLRFDRDLFYSKFKQYENMAKINNNDAVLQILYFAESFAKASLLNNPNLKSNLYLYGAPGTGKSEAAQLIADAIEVPLIKINLNEVKNVLELKGVAPGTAKDLPQGRPGIIAEKLIELKMQGHDTNRAIIFFDNADRILNQRVNGEINPIASFMLNLSENQENNLENPFFKAPINIQNLSILIAGNSLLNTQALQDRFDTVYIGGYSLDYRKQIGRERFLANSIADYNNLLRIKDFSDYDLLQIDSIAAELHKKIIPGQEITSEPGFREHQRQIQKFVHNKAMQKN